MAGFWLGPKAAQRGYRLFGFDSVGSTNNEAAQAARLGDSGDVWFCALSQTAGRGRRGRAWQSAHGNLAASILVVPETDPAVTATLGFVAGVALSRALARIVPAAQVRHGIDGADFSGGRIALKWPNDVLADGAKLSGLLLEAHRRPDGGAAVVVGIGVNVVEAPKDLPYPAICLRDLGIAASAEEVFAELSESWVEAYETWNQGAGIATILDLWRQTAAGRGAEVAVQREGDIVRGIFEDVDETGRLIVRTPAGQKVLITAGDVHFGTTASLRMEH